MNQRSSTAEQHKMVKNFNDSHGIGTRIRYWPIVRGRDPGAVSKTRSRARLLSGHTAVVWVEDRPDCVALTHVDVIDDTKARGGL